MWVILTIFTDAGISRIARAVSGTGKHLPESPLPCAPGRLTGGMEEASSKLYNRRTEMLDSSDFLHIFVPLKFSP